MNGTCIGLHNFYDNNLIKRILLNMKSKKLTSNICATHFQLSIINLYLNKM